MTDVTCKITESLISFVEYKGLDIAQLVAGLPYSETHLRKARNRIDWDHFVTINDRFVEMIGGVGQIPEYFDYTLKVRSAWLSGLRSIAGLMTSPLRIYKMSLKYFGPSLFSSPVCNFYEQDDGSLKVHMYLPEPYAPSKLWFLMCAEAYRATPRLLGMLDSVVEVQAESREAWYHIIPPRSFTLWARIKRAFRAMIAIEATVKELSHQESLLKRDYERLLVSTNELKRIRAELEDRVRDRTKELEELNRALTVEVQERKRAEEALRESEAFFKSLFQNVPALAFFLDQQGRFLAVNDLSSVLGQQPNQLLGKTLVEVFSEEFAADFMKMLQSVFTTGQTLRRLVSIERDAGLVWLDKTLSPVRKPDGSILAIAGVCHDITEHKRIQDELIAAKEGADAANRAKSQFLANMSHEIRTPMTAILGFVNILQMKSLIQEPDARYLERIQANGQRLMNLINDILDLSRVESGHLKIDKRLVDLQRELDDALDMIRHLDKSISIQISIDPQVPKWVWIDEQRLRQIFINIVGNAVKFTDQGQIIISVKSSSLGENQAIISIVVKDSGCGIAPDQQKILFQLFSQADDTDTRRYGGTGLGLLLSRNLARAMGGDVVLLESQYGKGSAFEISVKVELDDCHASVESGNHGQNPAGVDDKPLLGCKILMVEDSPDIQLVALSLLKSVGAEVDSADNGADGLAKALVGNFDILLVDIQMPGMDGFEMVSRLRHEGYTGPVFALTSYAMSGDREQCLQAGFDEHLTKPFKLDELISTIVNRKQSMVVS